MKILRFSPSFRASKFINQIPQPREIVWNSVLQVDGVLMCSKPKTQVPPRAVNGA